MLIIPGEKLTKEDYNILIKEAECCNKLIYNERINKMKKFLTEVVKIGGWIIVAIEELLKVL